MPAQRASRTALIVAACRALHQSLDGGDILADPFAGALLGAPPERLISPRQVQFRRYIAARSRFAERALREAVTRRGVEQVVVLGAGLDTFALRNPFGGRLRVFEVDHPATQADKRRRLRRAGLAVPPWLRFVSADLEADGLVAMLAAQGFDPGGRSFFIWLGVAPYLSRDAVLATLSAIAGLPGGAEVVFNYLPTRRHAPESGGEKAVAALGEPIRSWFLTPELGSRLRAMGYTRLEDFGLGELMRPVGPPTKSRLSQRMVLAATPGRDAGAPTGPGGRLS